MTPVSRRLRALVFVAALVFGGASAARAQTSLFGCGPLGHCGNSNAGTYGPAVLGSNPSGKLFSNRRMGGCEPQCAVNSYPLSDWAYIRKFCGPQLIPGSCYGHFQTKWRKWEDHCPAGGTATGEACAPGAIYGAEPMIVPSLQVPVTPTVPSTPTTPTNPTPNPGTKLGEPRPIDIPKPDLPKVDVPKSVSATVPAQMPKISTAEAMAPVVRPREDGTSIDLPVIPGGK